jgi:aspartokinase/homoserine dehydrogenase 1
LDVFLVGCGTVGAELLKQIQKQQAELRSRNIRLNVYGIANSRQLLLDTQGIDLSEDWSSRLSASDVALSTEVLKSFVNDNALVNPVVVDCTSSEQVADQYLDFLGQGFHVVTPNKKANTKSLDYYHQLQQIAQQTNRQYLYETTVGAGLPVIDNLQKLLSAGDTLESFEGILSGSLSFVFGELEDGKSLSEATKIARDKGYTEPDPRDDLSGMDVARKLLIMAREANMALELEDIEIDSVLPSSFDDSGDVDAFLANIRQLDDTFSQRVQAAKQEGKVLRYVGSIREGKCKVSIQAVPLDQPLAAVRNGENALAFHSAYYQPIPYVIRGYGAGATVTAAGVFADILRTMPWKQDVN